MVLILGKVVSNGLVATTNVWFLGISKFTGIFQTFHSFRIFLSVLASLLQLLIEIAGFEPIEVLLLEIAEAP